MRSPERFRTLKEHVGDTPVAIVYNPNSGKKNKEKYDWERTTLFAQALTDGLGFRVNIYRTENEQHAQDIVGTAISKGTRLIGVKGGDGTHAHLAQDLVVSHHEAHAFSLGGGRQNVFQNELIKSNDPFYIGAESLIRGRPVQIDLGMITSEDQNYFFLANAGLGIDAYTLHDWEIGGKKSRRELFPRFWKLKDTFQPYDLAIKDDVEGIDKKYENIIQVIFGSSGKYAGAFPITDGNMRDGVSEVVVLPAELKEARKFFQWISSAILPGRTIKGADYMPIQDAQIRETNGEQLIFQYDGEQQLGGSDLRVSTLKSAATVWVPYSSKSYAFREAA